VTATTSKLVYTLIFDNSMLADDDAREKDKAQKTAQFTRALENMKILAEAARCRPLTPRMARNELQPPSPLLTSTPVYCAQKRFRYKHLQQIQPNHHMI